MIDFKEVISEAIAKVIEIDIDQIKISIETPKETENGDYAFPCFKLAKQLRKSPVEIARNIQKEYRR